MNTAKRGLKKSFYPRSSAAQNASGGLFQHVFRTALAPQIQPDLHHPCYNNLNMHWVFPPGSHPQFHTQEPSR
jgi:hypothetical protein